jgi:sec-independent protein translocase protein TatB
VRTGALWLGRAKRSFSKVKSEIEQQLNTDDIRRQLHNESILADIEEARKNANNLVKETQNELNKTKDDVTRAISSPARAPVVSSSAVEGVPTGAADWPVKTEQALAPAQVKAETAADDVVDASPAEPEAAENPPVQDFYNSPPTGVVTVQGRKLAAADKVSAKDSSGHKD